VTENYSDPTIDKPVSELDSSMYLGNFYYSEGGASGGFCQPAFYAYRYVRIADGGYGPLSDWTTQGVQSCACQLPCYPSSPSILPGDRCGADGILLGQQVDSSGISTCAYNTPVMVLMDQVPSPYNQINTYALNVHRQIGTVDPSSEGQLVGVFFLTPNPTTQGWYGAFTDILYSVSQPGTVCQSQGC
jgi:hypothetical protein